MAKTRAAAALDRVVRELDLESTLHSVLTGQTRVVKVVVQCVPVIDENGKTTYREVPLTKEVITTTNPKDAARGLIIADRLTGGQLGISVSKQDVIDVEADDFRAAISGDLDDGIIVRK